MTALLRGEGLVRRYGGSVALDGVDFEAGAGEVTAVIGGNGAGKSTLMRLLAGVEAPTAGRICLDGAEVRFASVREAERAGVVLIPQELSLLPNLTVAENLFLGRERVRLLAVDRAAEAEAAARLLARVGVAVAPATPLGALGAGEQQLVAIARALGARARALILDEPTAALGEREAERLREVVGELRSQGVAIVYISHRLEELLALADRVVVLRDGRVVGEGRAGAVDRAWIVERMAGAPPARRLAAASAAPASAGGVLLDVLDVRGVSLAVHAREIVGLYGLVGAGRTELLEALAGARPGGGGRVLLDGRDLAGLPIAERVRAGLLLVPEDRRAAGLLLARSVAENLTLSALPLLSGRPWLDRGRLGCAVRDALEELRVRPPEPARAVETLSGGNQQKVVLGRALLARPRVLLLDEPTRGVDVEARAELHAIVRRAAAAARGVLVSSSDADELCTLCDRVLVLAAGRLVAELPRRELSIAALVSAAAGAAA